MIVEVKEVNLNDVHSLNVFTQRLIVTHLELISLISYINALSHT